MSTLEIQLLQPDLYAGLLTDAREYIQHPNKAPTAFTHTMTQIRGLYSSLFGEPSLRSLRDIGFTATKDFGRAAADMQNLTQEAFQLIVFDAGIRAQFAQDPTVLTTHAGDERFPEKLLYQVIGSAEQRPLTPTPTKTLKESTLGYHLSQLIESHARAATGLQGIRRIAYAADEMERKKRTTFLYRHTIANMLRTLYIQPPESQLPARFFTDWNPLPFDERQTELRQFAVGKVSSLVKYIEGLSLPPEIPFVMHVAALVENPHTIINQPIEAYMTLLKEQWKKDNPPFMPSPENETYARTQLEKTAYATIFLAGLVAGKNKWISGKKDPFHWEHDMFSNQLMEELVEQVQFPKDKNYLATRTTFGQTNAAYDLGDNPTGKAVNAFLDTFFKGKSTTIGNSDLKENCKNMGVYILSLLSDDHKGPNDGGFGHGGNDDSPIQPTPTPEYSLT